MMVDYKKYIKWALVAIAAVMLMFAMSKCNNTSRNLKEQIRYNNSVQESFGNAVGKAVNRIDETVVTEASIDQAVNQVKGEIGDAKDHDDIYDAVVSSLCKRKSHTDDPACTMLKTGPG